AFEQSALKADHSAQFDHSADLGGVAIEIVIGAVVGKFSQKQARGFPLDGVADVVRILSVDDHGSLLDEVNGMSAVSRAEITNPSRAVKRFVTASMRQNHRPSRSESARIASRHTLAKTLD